MRKPATLITGANGEMGHGLITTLHEKNYKNIIGMTSKVNIKKDDMLHLEDFV